MHNDTATCLSRGIIVLWLAVLLAGWWLVTMPIVILVTICSLMLGNGLNLGISMNEWMSELSAVRDYSLCASSLAMVECGSESC